MRESMHRPAILTVCTLLALMPGTLCASPEETGGDDERASAMTRVEEARRRMVEAAADIRALRQRAAEAARALDAAGRPAERMAEGRAEASAEQARRAEALREAIRRVRAPRADATAPSSGDDAAEARPAQPAPIQRLAAALAQLAAQNRRLEARIASLEREQAKRPTPPRRRARGREVKRARTLEARLDRIEAKLDRLLRAGRKEAEEAPPTRAAIRFHRGASTPAAPPRTPEVRFRRSAPEAGATMMEIEKLLRRARERIRELERNAPPRSR